MERKRATHKHIQFYLFLCRLVFILDLWLVYCLVLIFWIVLFLREDCYWLTRHLENYTAITSCYHFHWLLSGCKPYRVPLLRVVFGLLKSQNPIYGGFGYDWLSIDGFAWWCFGFCLVVSFLVSFFQDDNDFGTVGLWSGLGFGVWHRFLIIGLNLIMYLVQWAFNATHFSG